MEDAEIRRKYDELKPLYERLLVEVKTTLQNEFAAKEITPSAILSRLKDPDNLVRKVARKKYAEPFENNEDFAGLRIVCLFTEELDHVQSVIQQLFKVLSVEDKSAALELDRMGYEGRHYIVTIADDWSGPRYNDLKNLRCEIQVRTICQDTWAQIDRHLDYPRSDALDPPTRRELYRMAALLETAQSSFDGVRAKRNEYARTVSRQVHTESEFLAQPVDRETVRAYVDSTFPGRPMKDVVLQLFLRDLDRTAYPTLRDIDEAMQEAAEFNKHYSQLRPDRYTSGIDYLTKGLGFADPGFRARHPFAPDTVKAISDYETAVSKRSKA